MKLIISSLFLFLLCSISLLSQKSSGELSNFLPECKNDQEKFCKSILRPKAKIAQCILEHTDDLSDTCKTNIKTYLGKMQTQTSGECKEDVGTFCRWVIPGGGRIIKCLFKNEASLSELCKKTLNQ